MAREWKHFYCGDLKPRRKVNEAERDALVCIPITTSEQLYVVAPVGNSLHLTKLLYFGLTENDKKNKQSIASSETKNTVHQVWSHLNKVKRKKIGEEKRTTQIFYKCLVDPKGNGLISKLLWVNYHSNFVSCITLSPQVEQQPLLLAFPEASATLIVVP